MWVDVTIETMERKTVNKQKRSDGEMEMTRT